MIHNSCGNRKCIVDGFIGSSIYASILPFYSLKLLCQKPTMSQRQCSIFHSKKIISRIVLWFITQCSLIEPGCSFRCVCDWNHSSHRATFLLSFSPSFIRFHSRIWCNRTERAKITASKKANVERSVKSALGLLGNLRGTLSNGLWQLCCQALRAKFVIGFAHWTRETDESGTPIVQCLLVWMKTFKEFTWETGRRFVLQSRRRQHCSQHRPGVEWWHAFALVGEQIAHNHVIRIWYTFTSTFLILVCFFFSSR